MELGQRHGHDGAGVRALARAWRVKQRSGHRLKLPGLIPKEQHHPVTIAAQHARTFRDALQRLARYKLLICGEEMRLTERKEECIVEFTRLLSRDELLRRGVKISQVFHDDASVHAGTDEPYLFGRLRVSGPDPEHRSYHSFASFSDPDGNGWLLQEVTTRLAGRIDSATTTFASTNDLASALRRAASAHGKHEARTGQADPNWPDWYAEYMVREQSGEELPQRTTTM